MQKNKYMVINDNGQDTLKIIQTDKYYYTVATSLDNRHSIFK